MYGIENYANVRSCFVLFESAAMKSYMTVAACVWLLEVWSYERFNRIDVPQQDPNQDDYPIAKG